MSRTASLLDTTVSIYGLIDPRSGECRYVGKAGNPRQRLTNHYATINRYKSHKNSWLKNLFAEGLRPELKIIDSGIPKEYADEAERFWIAVYRSWGCPLTNGTDGGDGGAITDPDALARIRAAHVGTKASAETRQKMSQSAKERCADPVERERLRSIANGKPPVTTGEENPASRFTEADVVQMRHDRANGMSLKEIAEKFQTSSAQVSYVVTGKTWAHVGGPIQKARQKKRLSDEDIAEIRRLSASGVRHRDLAVRFGIDPSHVSKIVAGFARKPVNLGGQ